jgi:hypothetical protein
MNTLSHKTGTPWAGASVIAHEIGHHVQGHVQNGQPTNPADELKADRYSGFILAKMKATLEEAQAAVNTLNPHDQVNGYYPPKSQRLAAIREGWEQGNQQTDPKAEPVLIPNLSTDEARLTEENFPGVLSSILKSAENNFNSITKSRTHESMLGNTYSCLLSYSNCTFTITKSYMGNGCLITIRDGLDETGARAAAFNYALLASKVSGIPMKGDQYSTLLGSYTIGNITVFASALPPKLTEWVVDCSIRYP